MAKTPQSELMELMKLLRRILVLSVAVYGLVRGMPYDTLLFRLAGLWAVLYICSGIVDVVFRRLSHSTALYPSMPEASPPPPIKTERMAKPARSGKAAANLPAVSTESAK